MEAVMNEIGERLKRGKRHLPRNYSFGTKVTSEEEKELNNAALAAGKNPSEWVREVLLLEARRGKNDAIFTEIVAMRMLLNQVLRPLALSHGMLTAVEHLAKGETKEDTGGEISRWGLPRRVHGRTRMMQSGAGASTMRPCPSNNKTRSVFPSRPGA